jgi:hypothetical protein
MHPLPFTYNALANASDPWVVLRTLLALLSVYPSIRGQANTWPFHPAESKQFLWCLLHKKLYFL